MNANKKLEDIIGRLNSSIKETIEYKQYCIDKRLLESNDRLKMLKENLNQMKHLMCSCDDDNLKEEYRQAREEYESSPLVVNYKISEGKLDSLIMGLIGDINEGL